MSKRAGVAEVTRRLREIEARREAIARRWQLLPRGGARSGDKRESEPGSEGSLEDGGWGSSWGLGVGEVATSVFGGYGMRDHRVGRKERGEGDAGGSPRHLRGGGAESGRAEGRQEHGARDRREASPGREGSGWRTGTDKEGLREGGTWWGRRVHEAGMRATVRRVMDGRRRFARRLRTLDSVFLGSLAGERGSVAPKSFTEVAERLAEEFLDEVVEREAIALSDGVETVAEDALAGL